MVLGLIGLYAPAIPFALPKITERKIKVLKLKLIAPLVIFIAFSGCKLRIDTPSGGEVRTVSGAYSCGSNQSCEIDVSDVYFREAFLAVPHDGYRFEKWKKKNRSFCSDGADRFRSNCELSSAPLAQSPDFMDLLASDTEFYLEPIFVREAVGESDNPSSSEAWVVGGDYKLPSIGVLHQMTRTYERIPLVDSRGGDREEIGLITEWQAEFLATGRNRDLIIEQADVWLGAPWCDFETMRAPYWKDGQYSLSFSHTPNLFFLPYLITGNKKYVAPMECQYRIYHEWLQREPVGEPMGWLTGRDMAWQLRNLGQLAFIEQRGDTEEKFYVDALERTRVKINERMSLPYESEFHVLGENQLSNADQWSGWFESFIGVTINHIINLGFDEWLPVAQWHFRHLEMRCGGKWSFKACDNDHVSLKAGATWANTHPYDIDRQSCYDAAPADELMPFKCGNVFMTFADRAQNARSWAAMAAANGIVGAQELYNRLDEQILKRGGTKWFKYNMVFPEVVNPGVAPTVPKTEETVEGKPNLTATNPAALLNATPGSWIEIPDSKIVDVLPPESFSQPIRYIVGPRAITAAWNGAVFNTHLQRLDIFASGGHGDYCGNEYLGFSLKTLQWELVDGPSDLTDFDLKSGTVKSDSSGQMGFAPDGKPISRHTYGGQVYHPRLKKSFMFGGSLCSGSGRPDDRWWSVTPDANYTQLGGEGAWTSLGLSANYDPTTNKIFLTLSGHVTEYKPSTNVMKRTTNDGSNGAWGQVAAIDPTRNNLFVFGHYNPANSASGAFVYHTRKKTKTPITLTGDLSIVERTGIGLEYVAELDRYVAWIEGSDLYFVHPETFHITRYETSGMPPTSSSPNGVYGRFAYSAEYGGFVVVTETSDNVFFLKLPGKGEV